MNTDDYKSFHYLENGEITFSNLDTEKTTKRLDSGCYKLNYLEYPQYRVELKLNEDVEHLKIHDFPDKGKLDILFKSFFNNNVHDKVKKMGLYHKIGVLLSGKEGTGKSTIVKFYSFNSIKKHNALVFYFDCKIERIKECWNFIMNVRKIQDNPIIVIFEEFEGMVEKEEALLKTVLDGNLSIDNCIFFATTNYLDKIPASIKERQSRFKYVLDIEGMQNAEEIKILLSGMIGDIYDNTQLAEFSEELKGNTLDHIKQFCIDKVMDLGSYSGRKKGIGFNFSNK